MNDLTSTADIARDYGLSENEFCELLGGLGLMTQELDGSWTPTDEMLENGYAICARE